MSRITFMLPSGPAQTLSWPTSLLLRRLPGKMLQTAWTCCRFDQLNVASKKYYQGNKQNCVHFCSQLTHWRLMQLAWSPPNVGWQICQTSNILKCSINPIKTDIMLKFQFSSRNVTKQGWSCQEAAWLWLWCKRQREHFFQSPFQIFLPALDKPA